MGLFDFNYYYGESSSSGWLEKTLPTLMGVVIGFALNRGYDFLREKDAIKKAGEEFINELELFKEPLAKQITSLDDLIEKLNDPITKDANLVGSIPVDTDRITSINRLYVYKHFKKIVGNDAKEARRVVNKLYGTLKVCSMEFERIKVLFENFTKARRMEVKRFNASLNDLLGNFSDLVIQLEKQGMPLENDKLYSELLPYFNILSDKGAQMNIDEIVQHISTPIIHVTAKLRHDERSVIFSANNRACFTCYREYLDIKREFIYLTKSIHSNLTKLNTQFISLLDQYGPEVLK